MGSFCFSKSDHTAFIIMKFIPPPNTVFVAKVHESTKKSRMSCQQRNVISKKRGGEGRLSMLIEIAKEC